MFAQKLLVLLMSNVVKIPIFFVSTILVARLLGPERLGVIAYVQAIVALLMIANDLSLNHTHVKRVSEGKDFVGCLRTYLTLKGATTVLTLVIFGIFVLLTTTGVFDVIQPEERSVFFVLFAAVLMNQSLNQLMITTFQAYQNVSIIAFVDGVSLIVFAISGVAILFWTDNLFYYSLTFIFKETVLFTLLLWFFWKTFRHQLTTFFQSRALFVGNYIRYALPQVVLIPLGLLNTHFDKVLIRTFLSTTQVGLYAASQRLSVITQFSKLFASLFLPELSRAHGAGELHTFSSKVVRAEKYLGLLFFSFALPLILFAPEVIFYTVGSAFADATPLLQVFLVYAVFDILVSPHRSVLYAAEKNRLNTLTALGGLVVFLSLSVLFIPESFLGVPGLGLGAMGIVLAQLIKTFGIFLLYKFFSWRFFQVTFSVDFVFYLAVALFVVVLDQSILEWGFFRRLLIDATCYVILIVLLRLLTRGDLHALKQILRPGSVREVVKQEFQVLD